MIKRQKCLSDFLIDIKNQRHLPFKRPLLALLFCLSADFTLAQTNELGTIIPPAPRTKEFEKFIKYDVSLAKGLVQTNLNFYNIDLDGVSIPIGIAYHASGISFGQTNGDVGLGWQLNPGFRVSRTVHGRLDEAYTMPNMLNVSSGQTIGYYLNNSFASAFARDLYIARYFNTTPDGDVPAIFASSSNYLDGEYEQFTFGLPGQSGSFIITDRVNKVLTTLDNSAMTNINYNLTDGVISDINAIDVNAVKYKFGTADANNEGRQIMVGGVMRKYNTAWMLSEVTTPFDNKINFQYQTISESTYGMPAYNRTIIDGIENGHSCYPSIAPLTGVESPASPFNYSSKIMTGITTQNETVTFTRNSGNNTVSSILISRPDGGQIKKVSFFYSQPASRIFLDSVHVAGTTNTVVERYRFEYDSKNVTFRNYNSFGYNIDLPGLGDDLANLYGTFNYDRLNCPGGVIGDVVTLDGEIKGVAPSTTGMLKKVILPTGGFREFLYGTNRYKVGSSPTEFLGDGLRIEKITSNDGVNGSTLIRDYIYGDGVRRFDPTAGVRNLKQRVVLASMDEGGGGVSIRSVKKTNQSSILDGEIVEAINQPDQGWYNSVAERFNEGKIEYLFEIPKAEVALGNFPTNSGVTLTNPPSYIGTYSPWNKPQLKEKKIYKTGPGISDLVQKEEYEYDVPSSSPSEEFTGFKVYPFALVDSRFGTASVTAEPPYNLYTNSGIQSVFNYATYTITRGDVKLKKRIITDYGSSGSNLVSTSEFTYSSYNLIASEKVTDSKSKVSETKYKYPFSYAGITASDNISAGIKKLTLLIKSLSAVRTCKTWMVQIKSFFPLPFIHINQHCLFRIKHSKQNLLYRLLTSLNHRLQPVWLPKTADTRNTWALICTIPRVKSFKGVSLTTQRNYISGDTKASILLLK